MNHWSRVVVEAPAKINLYLDIVGTAGNGYHLLETVMQAVSLTDVVVIGRSTSPGIRVSCSRPGVPEDATNLAHKAAVRFFDAIELSLPGLHIHIDKSIPPQAGLGGGSADAAAVLVGLNALFDAQLSPQRLCELGLALGADVPFAVAGGCALAQGVGEKLTDLPGLPPCCVVIAKPRAGVSTAEAYSRYDQCDSILHGALTGFRAALETGDLAGLTMFNVFEQVCGDENTAELRAALLAGGAVTAALSGSGSAVAGIFPDEATAELCIAGIKLLAQEVFLTVPVAYGPRMIYRS